MSKPTIQKGYFRGHAKYGRTTKLVINGVVVLEVVGAATLRGMLRQYGLAAPCNGK